MYICLISKIHREPCLDGKKKHIAPLKLVPDLLLQGLPKKLCSMRARTERTAGFAQKALLHSDLNRQLQWEGPWVLHCSRCPRKRRNAFEPSFLFGAISLSFFQTAVLCWSWVSFCENFPWENWYAKYRGALHFNSSQLWTPSGFPQPFHTAASRPPC